MQMPLFIQFGIKDSSNENDSFSIGSMRCSDSAEVVEFYRFEMVWIGLKRDSLVEN